MLNELSLLARSLEAKGLAVESWDDRIKSFKKGPAYVVRLGPDGVVSRVEWMDDERVAALLRISPQNEKSFPGFNLNHVVYEVDPEWLLEDGQPSLDRLWGRLVEAGDTHALGGAAKDRRALEANLRYPGKELDQAFSGEDEALTPTRALVKRMSQLEGEPFLRALGQAAVRCVAAGELDRDKAAVLLCGKYSTKKRTFEATKPSLILDVEDSLELGGRVASPEAARAWNGALLRAKKSGGCGDQIRCSLSGAEEPSVGEKMPQPNLPGLGLTYLMSMNKASPCQTRYGMTSTAVFPLGQTSAQRISDALQFITANEREGKTFARVLNAYTDTQDLLVAYLESDPASDLKVVELFANLTEGPEAAEMDYAARTESLLRSLKGRSSYHRDEGIRVFAISKLDPGRSQVLFNGRYSVAELEAGLDEWFHGARNIPDFSLFFAVARGQKAERKEPRSPSPIDVLKSFKTLWTRGGTESSTVPGVDLAQIYRLMLEPGSLQAGALLSRYLPLAEALLTGVGALRGDLKTLPERAKREALIAVPVLGLLLLKLGRKKESYMESREFLLGRFLQLADRLHKLYCEAVRKGDIPPQLAGNAALGAALQNPQRAFGTVSQRIGVYWAWADSCTGDKAGLAKWFRASMGEVCRQLQSQGLSGRIDDAGRAQLFLGYLGSFTKEEQQ